jgi:hypothetical protein
VTVDLGGRWPDPSIDKYAVSFSVVQPEPRHGWFFDKTWFNPQQRTETFAFDQAGLYEFDMLCRNALADPTALNFSEDSDGDLLVDVRVNS